MRIFGLLLALGAVALFAIPAQAGDRPHQGQGYHSSWDDVARTRGPHGQGDIFNFPRYYDPFYGGQRYFRDGFNLRYNNGDWSIGLNYGGRNYRQQPNRGRGHGRDYGYGRGNYGYGGPGYNDYYGYNNRVYYSPDGVSVRYLGDPGYADYYYRGIRPVDQYYRDQGYFDDWRGGNNGNQPSTVNIYNNYYSGEPTQAGTNGPNPNPPARVKEQPPVTPPPTVESGEIPWGRLFHGSALLTVGDTTYNCSLDNGTLSVGPEVGPGRVIAEHIDAGLGVLASYHPHEGLVFVFASDGVLTAAYESVSGWGLEPLPVDVDYSEKVSLGNMGGYPWVVFNGKDGTRYVYSYSTAGWQVVGSGSPPPDAE